MKKYYILTTVIFLTILWALKTYSTPISTYVEESSDQINYTIQPFGRSGSVYIKTGIETDQTTGESKVVFKITNSSGNVIKQIDSNTIAQTVEAMQAHDPTAGTARSTESANAVAAAQAAAINELQELQSAMADPSTFFHVLKIPISETTDNCTAEQVVDDVDAVSATVTIKD